jgi:hypothetical protein
MNIRDLYPQCDSDYFSVYSYQPMIDSFGETLVVGSGRGYQGDTYVLLEDAGLIGLIIFGWGSCPGCDALQGCKNYNDLQMLYDSMKSRIQWWESAEDALRYFEEHDWEGDYSWHQDEIRDFVMQCKDLLAAKVAEKHDYSCPSLDGDGKSCTCEQPMHTYVWEGVCCDYTPGMVVVVARGVKEALEMVKEQDRWAYDEVKDIAPFVCGTRSRVFIVKGGS